MVSPAVQVMNSSCQPFWVPGTRHSFLEQCRRQEVKLAVQKGGSDNVRPQAQHNQTADEQEPLKDARRLTAALSQVEALDRRRQGAPAAVAKDHGTSETCDPQDAKYDRSRAIRVAYGDREPNRSEARNPCCCTCQGDIRTGGREQVVPRESGVRVQ